MKIGFVSISGGAVVIDVFQKRASSVSHIGTRKYSMAGSFELIGGLTGELTGELADKSGSGKDKKEMAREYGSQLSRDTGDNDGLNGRLEVDIDGMDAYYLSVPAGLLNYRVVEMPFAEKKKLLSTLPYTLEGLIKVPLGAAVVDCVVLGQGLEALQDGGAYRVLAVYMDARELGSIVGGLKKGGIDPDRITSCELRMRLRSGRVESVCEHLELSDEERVSLCLEEISSPIINLRTGGMARCRDVGKVLKNFSVGLAIAGTMLLLLCLYLVLKTYLVTGSIESLNAHLTSSYKKAFAEETKVVAPLYQLKAKVKTLKDEKDNFDGISPLGVLNALSMPGLKLAPLDGIEMSTTGVTIKGEARRAGDVEDLKGQLDGRFPDVSVIETKTAVDGGVLFTITFKYGASR
ncbi:MAG: hypothetical protein HQK89_10450 [Nitrospirae bacterium]|nr:hypothetical protein [Nitrospirota bacterium]